MVVSELYGYWHKGCELHKSVSRSDNAQLEESRQQLGSSCALSDLATLLCSSHALCQKHAAQQQAELVCRSVHKELHVLLLPVNAAVTTSG